MERSWQYVQERINLIQEMNEDISTKSQNGQKKQISQQEISGMMMDPTTMPKHLQPPPPFVQPKVFDENGTIENTGMCDSGVCQYVPKSKPKEQIIWVNKTDQSSIVFQFHPPPPSPPSRPQTTSLKELEIPEGVPKSVMQFINQYPA